jgi:hypothetical protein
MSLIDTAQWACLGEVRRELRRVDYEVETVMYF